MRSRLALSILFMLASGSVLAQDVETEKGKLSYAVGWDIGADIKRNSTEFDVESLILAIRDVVADNESKVSTEEMRTLITALKEKERSWPLIETLIISFHYISFLILYYTSFSRFSIYSFGPEVMN